MTAALPVLRKADAVTILASADRELPISGEDAGRYLESHGVSCSVHGFKRGSESVPALLLSTAKKVGADCLLMGAYGHNRELQVIFGGVTQHVVDHRSDELRVGKECVSTFSSRWSSYHSITQIQPHKK